MRNNVLITSLSVLLLTTTTCKIQVGIPTAMPEPVIEGLVLNPSSKHVANPLGLDFRQITFEWQLPPTVEKQTAYQLLVASDKKKLDADVGDLWDSGIRFSESTNEISYSGKAIPEGTAAWWKVRIWDEGGMVKPFSTDSLTITEQINKPQRIAFIGGTTIANMERFAWLEAALTVRWPQQNLIFRNLGWPGDDIIGTARSDFGSALNTESWKPPDREDAYGLSVLQAHINLVSPDLVMLGYGSEAAFAETEEKFYRFTEAYETLLDKLDSTKIKVVLLSPHRHWKVDNIREQPELHNHRLKRVSEFIRIQAEKRGYLHVDLFENLVQAEGEEFTTNGIHLNSLGYRRMAEVVMSRLTQSDSGYNLELTRDGKVISSENCEVTDFVETPKGYRFTLKADQLSTVGNISLSTPHVVKIDGEIWRENRSTDKIENPDHKQYEELRRMIIEKNRLHRFRINPLNKVYTHLFRQHEMGHLAYETDDYARLTNEKDELIAQLHIPQPHRYEIELLDSWAAPRVYRDHEVPSFIPEPDIQAELDAFTIEEGFDISLFAADPQIANPISITWDNRGRAWVSTSTTYPQLKPGLEPVDKIIILEDTDQDGRADKHTVFAENLLIPHAVMPVDGGAYVSTTTELLFLSDADGDDKADERRVIFTGFGHSDVHHTMHSMRWTPWGDLHFIQSIYINTFIETAFGPRKLNGSGIWQFRPETERLEVFSRGLVNPWGEALNDWGQIFATDGAGSQQPSYLFPGSAHNTAVGSDRILDGLIFGKPKNTAAEFITGSHIPYNFRGSLLANDYRANRTVRYKITEKGSGYAAEEMGTLLRSSHRSYRPVDIKQGPDGAIYIVDWYSPIIDHGEVDFYHPSRDKVHGRIWRLTSKGRPLNKISNVKNAKIPELLNMLKSTTMFTRMQANRELVTRDCPSEEIRKWVNNLPSSDRRVDHHRLEALWLGVALNEPDKALLEQLIQSRDHHALGAAIRMVPRIYPPQEGEKIVSPFVKAKHPQVRLEAINALRVMGSSNAAHIALSALDLETDPNLDYMLWLTARELSQQWLPALQAGNEIFDGNFNRTAYALKSMNNSDAAQLLAGFVREGRFEGESKQEALTMIAKFGESRELDMILEEVAVTKDTLLLEALVTAPKANHAVPTNREILRLFHQDSVAKIRELTAQLYGRWQIQEGKEALVVQATNGALEYAERVAAGDAIASLGDTTLLITIAKENINPSIKTSSLASWIKATPEKAAETATNFIIEADSLEESMLVFRTLSTQKGGAKILEEQFSGKILSSEKAIAGIRIAQSSGRDLVDLVDVLKVAGDLQPIGMLDSAQRKQLISDAVLNGNNGRGSKVYWNPQLLCSSCHRINGEGGQLGPDLSFVGAFMTPESILEAITNPNTAIKQGYETVIITKTDGSVISGTLDRRTDEGARIRNTSGDVILISTGEIENFEVTPISLMPPGLTGQLSNDEFVDLMAFLMSLGIDEE